MPGIRPATPQDVEAVARLFRVGAHGVPAGVAQPGRGVGVLPRSRVPGLYGLGRGRGSSEAGRLCEPKEGQGLCPWNPTKGRCPLDPRQGRSPWNPSLGDVGREGTWSAAWLLHDRRLSVVQQSRRTPAPLPSKPLQVKGSKGSALGGSRVEPWPSFAHPIALTPLAPPAERAHNSTATENRPG